MPSKGGTGCCVPGCSNRGDGHLWPSDKERTDNWYIAIRRAGEFDPSSSKLHWFAKPTSDQMITRRNVQHMMIYNIIVNIIALNLFPR